MATDKPHDDDDDDDDHVPLATRNRRHRVLDQSQMAGKCFYGTRVYDRRAGGAAVSSS